MINWLKKAFGFGRAAFGKARSGLESVLRMFNRGKEMYSNVRQKISDLPVIGPAANELVNRGEAKLDDLARQKLGFGMSEVNRGAQRLESALSNMPR